MQHLAAISLRLLLFLVRSLQAAVPRDPPPLTFTAEGAVRISSIEDRHVVESLPPLTRRDQRDVPTSRDAWVSWGPVVDLKSVRVIGSVVDSERPVFVVLNVDLITGENIFLHNAT